MHPFEIETTLIQYGSWYTYWQLRNRGCTRLDALWLLWVTTQMNQYRNRRYDEAMR